VCSMRMTARIIIGIVGLVCMSICAMLGTFKSFEMIDKVNERLPKEKQFESLGWYSSKYQRLDREYRRLYPDGRLLMQVRILGALGIACSLISGWGFGFFAK
jgi:hypothetical protein